MSCLIDKMVPPEQRAEMFAYLDDFLVISESYERHLEVLRCVAKIIRESGLTINVEKSHFCIPEVK